MRYIMTTLLPDNEIEWLLDYWQWKGTKGPYSLMDYLLPTNSGRTHLTFTTLQKRTIITRNTDLTATE